MKEIIDWQTSIEKMLCDFYRYATDTFQKDEKLAGFLKHLAEDEYGHFCVMRDTARHIKEEIDYPPIITVDKITKKEIKGSFIEKRKIMSEANLSKEQLIDFIVTTEFSGLNATFLYLFNSFNESRPDFIQLATKIQKHEKDIEEFVESLSYGPIYLDRIRKLQKGCQKKKLLLVDDAPAIIKTLSVVFKREFIIETAENGEDGFKKTNEQYFDVIISDMDMPFMNGMDFYNKATKKDANIGERFLFFTGSVNPELSRFFSANHLRRVQKPASIKELKQAVFEIIQG